MSSPLSAEQIDELETTVKNLYTNGNTDEQDEIQQTWFTDPQYFSLAQQIIEISISDSSTSKIMLTHFALRSISSLLDYVCPTWSILVFKETSKWCLKIFIDNIDRFMSTPLLMQAFCKLYAQLVILGWHCTEEFQEFISPIQSEEFWENILNGSCAQWSGQIQLYTAIVEKMSFIHNLETLQVNAYKEGPLFDCFDFAVKTLDHILNQRLPPQSTEDDVSDLIEHSLQLLNACLSFDYYLSEYDNIDSANILLPSTWSSEDKLSLNEIVDCLFQLYETTPPDLQEDFLNVLFLFSSIRSDVESRVITDRLIYAEPFFVNISKSLNQLDESIVDNENLPLIINIILKIFSLIMESSYENLSKKESFTNFIQAIYSLTKNIFCVDFLLKSSDSIMNMLKCWKYLSEIINKCNTALELTDYNIKRQKHMDSKAYILDESDYEPLRQIVDDVEPLIEDVVDSYILLLNQVVQEQPEAAHEVFFTDITQTNPLMNLVLSIHLSNKGKFYKKTLDIFNELLTAYKEDPSNLVVELQLGLFSVIISPLVFHKIKSKTGLELTINSNIMPTVGLQQAHSFPFVQTSLSSISTNSFTFHPHFHESEGENLGLGFGHTDHFTSQFSSTESNPNAEDEQNNSEDNPFESLYKNIELFVDESMAGILQLFQLTGELIQNGYTDNVYMEEIVLYLITEFTMAALINRSCNIDLPPIVAQNTNIKDASDLNKLFISRIFTSICTFSDNDRIISLSMDAIAKWGESKVIPNKTDFIEELLDVYYSKLTQFFDSMHAKHTRVRFYQIMGQIIDSEPDIQIFYTFFEKITSRYEQLVEEPDECLALGLILDLRGIVSGTGYSYALSFDYIFPKLELFHQMALDYPSLVIPYLKFLTEFTKNKKSRLSFYFEKAQHSSNGLKLAKAAMSFCIVFFENAPRSLDQSSEGLYSAMKIMKNVFNLEYSNLGAMIAYNDPILGQLFEAFLDFAHVLDFNDIVRYPKHLCKIIQLMESLFAHFSNFIVDIDISFLQTALIICTYSDDTKDLETINLTFKVISSITDCCVRLLDTEKGQEIYDNTRDTFANVLQMLENCIMKMRFNVVYKKSTKFFIENNNSSIYIQLIKSTKNVLRMEPPNWPEVKQRLSLFLGSIDLKQKSNKDQNEREIKELIDDLVSVE